MESQTNYLIQAYNAKNLKPANPQKDTPTPMGGKMLKLYNLLADNKLQYLYPQLECKNISVEGLVKLSRDFDFLMVMKKLCKIKQRDSVKLMTVVVKYISAEYAAGRQIEEDEEIVRIMQNRSKNRVPRYEEDDMFKLPSKDIKDQPIIIKKTSCDPNLFQQPAYNPFEMKYRMVDSFPEGEVINKENMIARYSRVVNPTLMQHCDNSNANSCLKNVDECINQYQNIQSQIQTPKLENEKQEIQVESNMIKCEKSAFSDTTERNISNKNIIQRELKSNLNESIYPSMINLSSPFVITKMNMTQILYRNKIKQERQNFINPCMMRTNNSVNREASSNSDNEDSIISLNINKSRKREMEPYNVMNHIMGRKRNSKFENKKYEHCSDTPITDLNAYIKDTHNIKRNIPTNQTENIEDVIMDYNKNYEFSSSSSEEMEDDAEDYLSKLL